MGPLPDAELGSTPLATRQKIGLVLGPALFLLVFNLPPPPEMGLDAWRVAGVAAWVATWWATEAIPLPATALLPLVLLPLVGPGGLAASAAPYANPIIFLFIGGFILALAMERSGLHKRIALHILARIGTRPAYIIGGMMAATAVISIWVLNTSTTIMMLPIGLSVIELARRARGVDGNDQFTRNFATALMLGIAYAANLGGIGSLIGTAPNALFAAFMLESFGYDIGFLGWMMVGVPFVILSVPIAWWVVARMSYPVGSDPIDGWHGLIQQEIRNLGPMSAMERRVGIIFGTTAALWIIRPLLERTIFQTELVRRALPDLAVTDALLAVAGALVLFVTPSGEGKGRFLMDWDHANRLPWGLLILFGGGLSLADGFSRSGLADYLAGLTSALTGIPFALVILLVVTLMIVLTELTSNTATTATFLPIMASIAIGFGRDPLLLAIPATMAASCAFLLPVSTPPNAIVYGSGHITVPQMLRAGYRLNIAMVLLVTVVSYTIIQLVFV